MDLATGSESHQGGEDVARDSHLCEIGKCEINGTAGSECRIVGWLAVGKERKIVSVERKRDTQPE